MNLRALNPGDIHGVHAYEKQIFSDSWPALLLLTKLADGHSWGIFGEHDQLLGYAVFSVIDAEAELLRIAVGEPHRQQGCAGQLLDLAISELTRGGVERIFLEVRESNQAAQALYLSRGFVNDGRRKNYYLDEQGMEDALIFSRREGGDAA